MILSFLLFLSLGNFATAQAGTSNGTQIANSTASSLAIVSTTAIETTTAMNPMVSTRTVATVTVTANVTANNSTLTSTSPNKTATPNASNARPPTVAVQVRWYEKINWQGGYSYSNISATGIVDCMFIRTAHAWRSFKFESFLHQVDFFSDDYCLNLGIKGARQPGVADVAAAGMTNCTAPTFSFKVRVIM